MSEQAPKNEHLKQPESAEYKAQHEQFEQNIRDKAEQAKSEHTAESLKALSETVNQHAEASQNIKTDQLKDKAPDVVPGMQQLLKSAAYDQTLRRIQQKLPKTAQAFSKIAHNKTVDAASDIGANTIARPSGILGGSLCALLGSLILLYYSRHYGFRYNYGFFVVLFVGGFLVGLLAELAIWFLYTRKRQQY